jgi:type II secretory pathway pseudopilin PulG
LIICPSCGSGVSTDLCLGCPSCGARAIGPPLAKPEHELPSFGRGALAFIIGTVMFLTFAGLLISAFVENKSAFGFWTMVTAGEVAAWRVKWEVLLISVIALIVAARIVRSISQNPKRYICLLPAQIGLGGVLTVILLVAALIGITVPERMRQRQYSIQAAITARGYRLNRALMEYRELHGTLPDRDKFVRELQKLPDSDGTLADALKYLDPDPNRYEPTAKVASGPLKSKPSVRPVALRDAKTPASPEQPGLSFNSYELFLPSEHRWFAPDDDYIMRDGVIYKASDIEVRSSFTRRVP